MQIGPQGTPFCGTWASPSVLSPCAEKVCAAFLRSQSSRKSSRESSRAPNADRAREGTSPRGARSAICARPAAPPIAIGAGHRAELAARQETPSNAERPAGGRSPCGPLLGAIEKRPPRARRPALPQPCAAVLSAKAGLTAGFGMGPGDPRLCGRARGGRSPAALDIRACQEPLAGATLAAAWRARKKITHRARCSHRGCEELGLLVPLG